jgi:glutamate-1-semialdehyde 2,1-aminomutase
MVLAGRMHEPDPNGVNRDRLWPMGSIEQTFRDRTPRSAAHAAAASLVMPGGDTRAAGHHPPYQLTMVAGAGPRLTDLDGNTYLDLIGNFTSLVHGNAYPPIVDAARVAMEHGSNWPARNVHAVALAEAIVARIPSVEQVRFTNSGSEATMLAVEIARAATGRRRILMARFGYHGSAPHFEVGFHGHDGPETSTAPFGDLAAFQAALASGEIACVILEPVMGSSGLVEALVGFFDGVRQAAHRAGAVFVLDEVITLRLAAGGAQSVLGVAPDLTAMGKIIGGGFPVGAVGGRADLMALCDPFRPKLFHSGTFNGNPVTTAAGLVSFEHLTAAAIETMGRRAADLESSLVATAKAVGLPLSIRRVGSLLQLYFSETAPSATPLREDGETIAAFHLAALNNGVFLAPRGLVALSTVVDDGLVAASAERLAAAMAEVAAEHA